VSVSRKKIVKRENYMVATGWWHQKLDLVNEKNLYQPAYILNNISPLDKI
jgi:hypothetical protein